MEIYVELGEDIRYTATGDAQGPLHNLQSEARRSFSIHLVTSDGDGSCSLAEPP